MAEKINIPEFWASEYRFAGINCVALNPYSIGMGTDNVAGGYVLRFSAWDRATRCLTLADCDRPGTIGKILFLYTDGQTEPRRLRIAAVNPETLQLTLASDVGFSAAELAAIADWRGAVPDVNEQEPAFVIGDNNFAAGKYAFVSGSGSAATGLAAMASGVRCQALGDRSVAIGRALTVTGDGSVLIGEGGRLDDAGAFAVANDGLELLLTKTAAAGVVLQIFGTVRAAAITDLDGNPIAGGTVTAAYPPGRAEVPYDPDGDLLHLVAEFSATPDFSSPVRIDTRVNRDGVEVFASDGFLPFPADGVGIAYYGSVAQVKRPAAAATHLYGRYRWHDGTDYTSWRAMQ